MSKLSRRDFLKTTAAGAGALALGPLLDACGQATPSPLPATNTPASATNTAPAAADATTAPTNTTSPLPDVVVTRGGEPEELVRQAIAALGGMEKFVSSGANVVVKPNICVAYHSYEYAATTNPWVVGALVKMCYEAGAASVKVMDYPFGGTQKRAYEISGIQEQVEAAGGEMVNMLSQRYIRTEIPGAVSLKETDAYEDVLQADVLIDVPIAKHHSSSRLTLGMKNLMGVILDRGQLHLDLGQSIADLNLLIRPQLTVIDAVRILTANGPTGGNLDDVKKLDTVIASADVVAADSYATSLFGMKPQNLDYIVAGTEMGIGRSDLENLIIQEIPLGA